MKVMCIFGTRPEAIKMAPLISALTVSNEFDVKVCVTGQHKQMLEQVLTAFNIVPDYNLQVMRRRQDLTDITTSVLKRLKPVLASERPGMVFVHGDTTTTFAASLASFYQHIPIAHIEAGLRTGDLASPWPEEANRKLTSAIAALHFAPTAKAKANLIAEGIRSAIIKVTGNTVIDALQAVVQRIENDSALRCAAERSLQLLKPERRVILVTGHRRENVGEGFARICEALQQIASRNPDVDIIYPVHLSPQVQIPVRRELSGSANIHLLSPLEYVPFVYLMSKAHIIVTDSGGIQEEAPSLGKPVLVLRDTTERPEALEAGGVRLVGTRTSNIVKAVEQLLHEGAAYKQMSQARNPFGDGEACRRIIKALKLYKRSLPS